MSKVSGTIDFRQIGAWPDHAVMTQAQFCALASISEDTLRRLHKNGEGPPRVQLSKRRFGYMVGPSKDWLKQRIVIRPA